MKQLATPGDRFTLLDIGAASGDTARFLQASYSLASITNLDRNAIHLEQAPSPRVVADAFQLPFESKSFDFVLCSLLLHHFSNDQVISLLRAFYNIARRALLVCDLERHFLSYCFLPLTKPLFGWQRMTVHDGQISVRAGFKKDELLRLVELAGIHNARVFVHRPAFRLSLVAAKVPIIG